ncbi:T9SS type A sorting domain-containing protein [candidate division KSB1 bacterium]|nr:T9SS type A sorting domain-containing protein [candidate division KSB1 bacterium]
MQKKKSILLAAIICLATQMLHGQYQEFMYDGIMREYAVFEPSLDPNPNGYPLVVALHGAGSEGYGMISTAFLGQKAAKEKFIVAAPSALIYNVVSWWNAGDGYEEMCQGTDDLGFISAVIDTMIENYYNVDTTRIYLLGHSNGSMMAYRVAAELSHRIAAIATNTGQMVYEYCDPEYPVPIIHFHGLEDPICPYEGRGDSIIVLPHVDSLMAIWRGVNNCSSTPETIYNENGIVGKKWASLDGKGDIILYTIENWGHSWPRTVDPGIDATDVMWDFLKLHTRNIETSIKENVFQSMPKNFKLHQNYPNPFNSSTRIKYKLAKFSHIMLKIYNLAGQEIDTLVNEFQPAGEYEISWQAIGLPSGLYFYKIRTNQLSETRKLILQK